MLQQKLPSIDKLLQNCLVKLERIQIFTCDICSAVYLKEDRFIRHQYTHLNCEDTLVCNTESKFSYNQMKTNKASTCVTSDKTIFADNSIYSEIQQPYIPIRDRIKFETDSDDAPSDSESLEDNMSFSSDSALSTNDNQPLKFEQNTASSRSEVQNMKFQGTMSRDGKEKSLTSVVENYVLNKRFEILMYTSKLTNQGQVKIDTDGCGSGQFVLQTRHKQIQTVQKYSCDICKKSFASKHSLNNHTKLHILDKTLQCEFCVKTFMFKYQLKVHQRIHNDERPYSCKDCNKSFRFQSGFAFHQRSAHADLNIPITATSLPICEICKKRFSQKPVLLRHIFKYHMTTGYPCSICKKEFGHPVARDWHMNIHKSIFKCSICRKCFEKREYLIRCELSHKKRFECHNCNAKFGRKDHLTRHIKDSCKKLSPNLKAKPFKCQNCSKNFARKYQVKAHMKHHCKPHQCARCQKKFAKVATLKTHKKICKEKLYECDMCNKKFGKKGWMARHIKNNVCRKN